jgi:hypothetical protein
VSPLEYMAARAGLNVADIHRAAESAGTVDPVVYEGPEWRRVNALPCVHATPAEDMYLVWALTQALRVPGASRIFRPIQARALAWAVRCRGGFFEIEAGGGKTDLTAVLPTLFQSRRPLLLLPKNMEEETQRKFQHLNTCWVMPRWDCYTMQSYHYLANKKQGEILDPKTGVKVQDDFLTRFAPDLVVADEAEALASGDAVARVRLERYLEANPDVPFFAMSATFGDLSRYMHLLAWALRDGSPAPLPHAYREGQLWCQAIDHKTEVRARGGALLRWASPEDRAGAVDEEGALRAARQGYQARYTSTPGVVVSLDEPLDLPLSIQPLDPWPGSCPKIEDAFRRMRAMRVTPTNDPVEDDPVADGKEEWAHALQLGGCGLSYTWDPPAPQEWRDARTETFRWVRKAVRQNDVQADSWAALKDAIAAGRVEDGGLVARWLEIAPTFVPNPVPVWVSDEPLNAAAEWLAGHSGGVVWTQHTFFARRLAQVAGVPYFGEKGLDAQGNFILDHKGPCIASIWANGRGRNMQLPENGWHDMLYMCFPQNEKICEQSLARVHRRGQTAPEVRVWAWVGCFELAAGYWEARAAAQAQAHHKGVARRVLYAADLGMPEIADVVRRGGYRWTRGGAR